MRSSAVCLSNEKTDDTATCNNEHTPWPCIVGGGYLLYIARLAELNSNILSGLNYLMCIWLEFCFNTLFIAIKKDYTRNSILVAVFFHVYNFNVF